MVAAVLKFKLSSILQRDWKERKVVTVCAKTFLFDCKKLQISQNTLPLIA